MRHSGEWRRRGDLPREFNLNGASSESPRKPVVADVNRHLVPSRITIGTAVAITRNRGQLGSESQPDRGESLYPPIPPTLGTGAWPVASPGHTNPPCPHLFSIRHSCQNRFPVPDFGGRPTEVPTGLPNDPQTEIGNAASAIDGSGL